MGWLWLALGLLVGGPGLILIVVGLRTLLLPEPHSRFLGFRPLLARLVRWRLGGSYRHQAHAPDPKLPTHVDRTHRVAVIGGGIAGLSAAATLAERGVSVTLYESNTYLGGKIGAWPVFFDDGSTAMVEHGFHAYFRHYWNLSRFLSEKLGVLDGFRAIEEYVILKPDGARIGFGGVETTPALNIVDLSLHGVYDWRPIVRDPIASKQMEALLRYDVDETFETWDDTTFASFAEKAGLDEDLALAFTSFSRAFFADPDRMSMAELIKSFHFYYLSHDSGLDYDFPVRDHHEAVLEPWREYLEANEVDIRLATPVKRIDRTEGGFDVDGSWYDEVILAASLPGAKAIVGGSPDLQRGDPDLARRMATLPVGQRYAVLRLWLSEDPVPADLPMFTITDRLTLLDSVTTYHRYEPDSQAWVRERGGGAVLELHCYAVPDEMPDDATVRRAFLADLTRFFPGFHSGVIVREHLQVRSDFPAFHQGLWRHRPGVGTAIEGFQIAGDWVKLPFPAMLMEGAFSAGLLAANDVLGRLGVQGEPVYHVPLKGLLAGVPDLPGSG